MSQPAPADDFAKAIKELLDSKGIELPSIPSSSGRNAYLQFLKSRGYREEELLPVIQRDKVTAEMKGALLVAVMRAVDSDDPKFVKAVMWMAYNTIVGRDNTNLIVYGLANALVEDLRKAGTATPSFYAGVFPTDSYNAQCATVNGENLVLLDTGCLEMAEAIVASFLSNAPTQQKTLEISSAIDNYVLSGQRADSSKANTEGIDFGSGPMANVVNSFEEYMLAHELGHLSLGHVESHRIRYLNPRLGAPVEVVEKSEFQEFQADMWAFRTLIDCARKRGRTDSDVPLAIAGISLGLGVGFLVEASAKKHGLNLTAGHPPAYERLYMAGFAYELFGAHEEAFLARRFNELIEKVIDTAYPDAELPPIFTRDLNHKLMPVLDSLGIDYSSYKRLFLTNE